MTDQNMSAPVGADPAFDNQSNSASGNDLTDTLSQEKQETSQPRKRRGWTIGILADKHTDEVPGSVLLLSEPSNHNAPLGLQNAPARTSNTSLQSSISVAMFGRRYSAPAEKKKTSDGKIILDPQPDDSLNDPLNWSKIRRDAALFSLGLYCMMGGGMTSVLAAGFTNVSETFDVSVPKVALTTGLYMMGLGCGSVIASPTAIAFGKRPVYLVAAVLFALTSIWCALSPSFASLVAARVIMGLAVSPVECLPSATIAEIFFLHERAYRLGIYTLLLLGGKNLIPLVSAAIIQSLGWRWVFWIVALVVAFCFCLLFLFVPETFWDRTPQPHGSHRRPSHSAIRRFVSPRTPRPQGGFHEFMHGTWGTPHPDSTAVPAVPERALVAHSGSAISRSKRDTHAHFGKQQSDDDASGVDPAAYLGSEKLEPPDLERRREEFGGADSTSSESHEAYEASEPHESNHDNADEDYFSMKRPRRSDTLDVETALRTTAPNEPHEAYEPYESVETPKSKPGLRYTRYFKERDPKTFRETLKPYSGRLNKDNWFRVAARPFILFAYPAILWSSAVYALSVGWLIVLSESVATIYRNPDTYNFSAISTGVIYISPFLGGILGTVVAGKVSDIVVRFISRRNDGVYEPEFRLVMAIPVALATTIGLMGFGWSAQEQDNFWVPTIFFGIISFGCTLGSTTAITFAVDSYRQFAGEALVTLNFSKNIFHGLVFSLFIDSWLESDGAKTVFLSLGGIQMFFLLFTIPMYIFGKRARMWTVRKNLMAKF